MRTFFVGLILFQNRRQTPSGRKVEGKRKKERTKIMPLRPPAHIQRSCARTPLGQIGSEIPPQRGALDSEGPHSIVGVNNKVIHY